MTGTFRQCAALAVALAASPALALAQGTITGRVIDQATQQGIPSAQVLIVGTQRGAVTGDRGQYQIRGVPAGQVQLRAVRIGYQAESRTITVPASGEVTADFALSVTAQLLDVVTTTATGEQQLKRESGASTGNINVAEDVPLPAVKSASQLLNGRVAGVTVMQAGGTAGAASRIRIRGSNSVSLTNNPLVIIDGVRVNNNQSSGTISVGGQDISRFDDLDPEQIENIEVIKGPSAAALYGTAAANGVIQITTKKGRAGRTRWNAYGEYGTVKEVTDFPANYASVDICDQSELDQGFCGAVGDTIWGNLATTGGFGCTNDFAARGFCTQDGLASFNPLEQNSPFQTGFTQKLGLNAAGGTENLTFYVGGDFQREEGVYAINTVRRVNGRANLHAQLRDNLDVTVNTGYYSGRTRLPQNDNNVKGIIPSGTLGYAFPDGGAGQDGYGFFSPADIFGINTRQNVERFTGSVSSNWQPIHWLTSTSTFGLDFTNRHDNELIPPATSGVPTSPFADDPEGKRISDPFQTFLYTLNTGLTANYGLTESIRGSSSAGVQYNSEIVRGTQAFGQRLLAGTGSLHGAATFFAVDETNEENVTLGGYLSQQIAWRDRLFLTAALRGDKNSAFGQDFKAIYYPAFSLSYVVGDEPWFPTSSVLSSVRLRSAYGESGQRPEFRDAIRFLTPVAVTAPSADTPGGVDEPAFITGGVGLPDLKPERSREIEGGVDLGFWNDRIALELTYFRKSTEDALIARRLPPSNGIFQTQFQNLGEVRNTGVEFLLNGRLIESGPVRFEVTVNGATLENKVINLGEGISAIAVTNEQDHRNGFPLGGYFQRKIIGWEDKNGDGLISRVGCARLMQNNQPTCEVFIEDEESFIGTPFPRREVAVTPALTLFNYVRLQAMFDHKGGHKLLNNSAVFRCASGVCRASEDPSAPQADQATYVAGLLGTNAGYIEDATFTKLRELALTLNAPQAWSQRVGVTGLSLTLAGRNLKTWTDYTGLDPEANNYGAHQFATDEFLTQPQTRYWTARLDVTW